MHALTHHLPGLAIAGLALIVLVWRLWLRFRGPDFVDCRQYSHQVECISRCKRCAP